MNLNAVSYNPQTLSRAFSIADAGHALEAKGDIQGAIEKYEEAVKINSQSAYLFALLGKAYHKVGEDDKALAAYETALKTSPQHFWVHYLIGELYRDEHRYKDAITKLNELVSMKDNEYGTNRTLHYTQYQDAAYGQLGFCYAKIGEGRESLAAYQQYLIKNPAAQDRKFVEDYIQRLQLIEGSK